MLNGIGQRIRVIRELNNLSMEELAERVSLPSSYIELIESGDCTPCLRNLIDICSELNASLDYIVNGYDGRGQDKLSPFIFKDEDVVELDLEWDALTKKVDFAGSIENIIIPYNFNNKECLILLETIKHFVEQMHRVKQMKRD